MPKDVPTQTPVDLNDTQERVLQQAYNDWKAAKMQEQGAARSVDRVCTVLAGEGYHIQEEPDGRVTLLRAESKPDTAAEPGEDG